MVVIGRLGRPRGVNGEIFVTPQTDFPERFVGMKTIHVHNRQGWQKLNIVSSRIVSGRPVLRFEGIENPEQARLLTNLELGVVSDELVDLPEGSHYLHELVDCEVVDETNGEKIGVVESVEQYPANDVYRIAASDGRRLSIAAVRKFVKHVDVRTKKIVIDAAGLVETA